MRRVLALAIGTLALAMPTAAAPATTPRPALHLAAGAVKGTHFRPQERVRVVFHLDSGPIVRRPRTTRTGTFSTPLPAFDPCLESLRITAVGARSERAALKLPQRACPPSLGPPG